MVGIVVISHSADLARGVVELAREMAGSEVRIETAGGNGNDGLGTNEDLVKEAIASADSGDGVIVLGDLGSAFLTVRHVLERSGDDSVHLVDAPLVEGTVAAAVVASVGQSAAEVTAAAEETRGAAKL
jgi:phosphoenolpyruvate---glycerone phosphotransferase subunit DhaM